MLRIPWTEHVSYEQDLKKMRSRNKLIIRIRKKELKFQGHIIRMDDFENIAPAGRIDGRIGKGKQ